MERGRLTNLPLLFIATMSILAIATSNNDSLTSIVKEPKSSDLPINKEPIGRRNSHVRESTGNKRTQVRRKLAKPSSSARNMNQDADDHQHIRSSGYDQLELAKEQALMMDSHNNNTPPLFVTKTRDLSVDVARHPNGTKIATIQAIDTDGDDLMYFIKPASLHDASPYFSIDTVKGDLILNHKQFVYYASRQISERQTAKAKDELAGHHEIDNQSNEEEEEEDVDDDDEEEGEMSDYKQFNVNKNLYFLNVVAFDGRYPVTAELLVHVHNSSSAILTEAGNVGLLKQKVVTSESRTTRAPVDQMQHKISTTLNSSPNFGAFLPRESPTSEITHLKQLSRGESLSDTQSSSLLNQPRPLQPNDGQLIDQQSPLIPQSIVVCLVIACSCLMIALVLFIFIIPLSMRLRRRLKHVERQHEHLSQQNSSGSSFVGSSSGSMATHSQVPSLSQFTLGSDVSCTLDGSSVIRQSSVDSSLTMKPPPTNSNGPFNRVNNGFIVNPLYLQQQHLLVPNLQYETNRPADQQAYLMDRISRREQVLNQSGDEIAAMNDYPDYSLLEDDLYSTISPETVNLNYPDCHRKPLDLPVFEDPLTQMIGSNQIPPIDECQQALRNLGPGIESPTSDSGSSIRSLVQFLSLPDRRHTQTQSQGMNHMAHNTRALESVAPNSRQQAKTIARASGIAREQVNNDLHRWELDRHRLTFLEILGQGQFGLVWRCELKTGKNEKQTVAVKTLKKNALQDKRGKGDLLAEIKIMKMVCQHPNVVKIRHCCTLDVPLVDETTNDCSKSILLVMEYVDLGKLQSFLEESRVNHRYATHLYTNIHAASDHLTSRDLMKFIYHVAKGMEYISSQCIVHRDLASRNILINSQRICKIGDFGMARHMQSLGDIYERHSRNTEIPVRWMAPEVLKDNKFTIKSDVFSFGILMWEIVTLGSTPYGYLRPEKIPKQVVNNQLRPEKPDYCHPQLYEIMSRCWSHNSDDRPTFSSLVAQLDELLSSSEDYIELDQYPDNSYYNILETDATDESL